MLSGTIKISCELKLLKLLEEIFSYNLSNVTSQPRWERRSLQGIVLVMEKDPLCISCVEPKSAVSKAIGWIIHPNFYKDQEG